MAEQPVDRHDHRAQPAQPRVRPRSGGRPGRRPPARPAGRSRSRRPGTARRPRSSACRARARRRGTTPGTGRRWRGCAAAGTAPRRPPAPGRRPAASTRWVRADRSVEIDAMPGVSRMRQVAQPAGRPADLEPVDVGRPAGRRGRPRERRCRGSTDDRRGLPLERGRRSTCGRSPAWYQVTIWVHSPASVGASSSPSSALSRVDLPALTLPAIASRSGPVSRSPISASWRVGIGPVARARPLAAAPSSGDDQSSSSTGRRSTIASPARRRRCRPASPSVRAPAWPPRAAPSVELATARARRTVRRPGRLLACAGGAPARWSDERCSRWIARRPGSRRAAAAGSGAGVAALLVHDEADLVDVPAGGRFRLLLAVVRCRLRLVPDDLLPIPAAEG